VDGWQDHRSSGWEASVKSRNTSSRTCCRTDAMWSRSGGGARARAEIAGRLRGVQRHRWEPGELPDGGARETGGTSSSVRHPPLQPGTLRAMEKGTVAG